MSNTFDLSNDQDHALVKITDSETFTFMFVKRKDRPKLVEVQRKIEAKEEVDDLLFFKEFIPEVEHARFDSVFDNLTISQIKKLTNYFMEMNGMTDEPK